MFETRFLKKLKEIRFGRLHLLTPDGGAHIFTGAQTGIDAHLQLKDWRVISHAALKGNVGFAEDYRDDLWDSDDLPALLSFFLQNQQAIAKFKQGSALMNIAARLGYFLRLNSERGAKRNIHAHYDLGNDFYALWLDSSMTYSSALFDGQERSLAAAQRNKYERILSLLGSTSGRLLEIGCGWGGFIRHAMKSRDFVMKGITMKGITLSEAQHDYARHDLLTHNIQNQAEVALEDYRHQKGRYDHIVSIEMFEAVGERYWPVYFNKIAELLSDKGRAVIQAITIGDGLFETYRRSSDVIRSFIFPGGMLPSRARFYQELRRAGLAVADRFEFGCDYVKTLQCWLENFDKKQKEIRALGFDRRFIRMWRFYLAACIAGFRSEQTNVMQVSLVHA